MVAPGVKEIMGRIGDNTLLMAKTVRPFDMKFEQYLEHVSSHISAMMREVAVLSKEVQDWLKTLLGLSLATAEQRQALRRARRGRKYGRTKHSLVAASLLATSATIKGF